MNDRLLRQCRRLFLRGLDLPVHIGIHDFEIGQAQRVRLDIDLYVPLAATSPAHDQIDEVVDYDFVRAQIAQRVATGHVTLQETLCDDLVASLLAHPGVWAVRLSTCKPDVYPDCAGVGVEVFRVKEACL